MAKLVKRKRLSKETKLAKDNNNDETKAGKCNNKVI